ncbi:MAG: hypothetical protein J4452_03245 [Candidatus Aenigmarchaeota archaeon]|nr:hypothetical protein [Candidatus Aenigmarchaeota archaeon]
MIILFFALMDILGGLAVLDKNFAVLVAYLAYAHMIKGGFSLFGSLFSGYFFDWMGAIDLIGGIVLLLISFKISFVFFPTIGWIFIGKGIYTFIRWLFHV